jgi:hypothetical protein
MPATSVSSPLIGASLVQVWKPALDGVNPAGAFYDKFAPFVLGTTVHAVPSAAGGRNAAVFCRVGATGIAAGATAGITNGATVAAAAGNTYTNDTGQALVTGDYAFLTAADASAP